MPANLNALIRYKTINSCMFGGKRMWSVTELIEKCSEALADSRGVYTPISERTLRDDLRVMRSDILGFNAPIEQVRGLYFYADPHYSILSLKITDANLADRIYTFLLTLKPEIQHPELESILKQLCELTGKPYEQTVPEVDTAMSDIAETAPGAFVVSDDSWEPITPDIKKTAGKVRFSAKSRLLNENCSMKIDESLINFDQGIFMKVKPWLIWGELFGKIITGKI